MVLMSYNLLVYRHNPRILNISNQARQTEKMLSELKPIIQPNTILCLDGTARGWIVLAFDRGINEIQNLESCISIVENKNSDHGILLEGNRFGSGFYELTKYTEIVIKEGTVVIK